MSLTFATDVTSDTENRTVSPTDGQDTVLNNITGSGIGLSTNEVTGNETSNDEIIARVEELVNAYDHTNNNSK